MPDRSPERLTDSQPSRSEFSDPQRVGLFARSYSNAFHQVFARAGTGCMFDEPSLAPMRDL